MSIFATGLIRNTIYILNDRALNLNIIFVMGELFYERIIKKN